MGDVKSMFENAPVVAPDKRDLAAIKRIEQAEDEAEGITIRQMDLVRVQREYSGKISLRLPKTLHKNLAQEAESEGISLNQFILYKLAR